MERQWLFFRLLKPRWMAPAAHPADAAPVMLAEVVAHLGPADTGALWRFQRLTGASGPHVGFWVGADSCRLHEVERRLRAKSAEHNWPVAQARPAPETAKYRDAATLATAERLASVSSDFALDLLGAGAVDGSDRADLALAHLLGLVALVPEAERAGFLFECWRQWTTDLPPDLRLRLGAGVADGGRDSAVHAAADRWPEVAARAGWQRYLTAVAAVLRQPRAAGMPANFLLFDHAGLTHRRLGIDRVEAGGATSALRSALKADPSLATGRVLQPA